MDYLWDGLVILSAIGFLSVDDVGSGVNSSDVGELSLLRLPACLVPSPSDLIAVVALPGLRLRTGQRVVVSFGDVWGFAVLLVGVSSFQNRRHQSERLNIMLNWDGRSYPHHLLGGSRDLQFKDV